jgi:hypothetical protein
MSKYDTHVHTSQGSACGNNTGAEMVKHYKSLGYAGFIVTDHFCNGNTAIPSGLPWDLTMDLFCAGYEDAKRYGDEVEFDVFFGFEYAYHGTEFIILGLDKIWLKNNPQIMSMELKPALKYFREQNAFIIHAHPFREASYINEIRLLPEYVDAVEVYNAGHTREFDRKAKNYAEKYNLPQTAGGDAHYNHSKPAGISACKRVHTIHELINVIQTGNYSLTSS